MQKKFIANVFILVTSLVLLFLLNLFFGTVKFSLSQLKDPSISTIFYDIRIPKSFTALLAGAALALSGLLMQTLFRNPLAGPYVLGISSGAGLFVAISVMLVNSLGISDHYFLGKTIVTSSAITGALLVTLIILLVSKKSGNNITVLLVGMMLSQILGAFQGLIEYLASADSLKTFVVWGMGSVSNTTNKDLGLLIPVCGILFFSSLFLARPLNALLLNEAYAQNLGIDVAKLRITIIFITAVLTGIITAFCGPIAFVGMSVPIACRVLFKTSNQLHQMVYCMLVGAGTLLFCDTVCQLLSTHFSLPVNTITTLIGSPFVIYLIFKLRTFNG